MAIAIAHVGEQSLEVMDAAIDGTDVAARFGRLDAADGLPCSPEAYFKRNTPEWYAYLEGYRTGRIAAAILVGSATEPPAPAQMSELEFMEYAHQQLCAGTVRPTVHLTDVALAETEDEHIGADFCRQPYLY